MKQAQSEDILKVDHIVNRFGEQVVHDGVSFSVKRGEILAIVGGSGSGKSVLLKTILGLRQPNEGEILIEGKRIKSLKPAEIAAFCGVLFQEGALFSSLTVAQNIMVPLREHTQLPDTDCHIIAQLKVGLTGLPADASAKYPAQLSGGMVKRAALARALALDPEILFLDEPTSGLDPVAADEFDQLIVELNQSLRVTVVMVTHDLDTVFGVCDRVAVLVDKKVIVDTLANILKLDHPWIQEYFHGPRARGAKLAAEADDGKR